MAKQAINIGSVADDGTGSTLRAGGDLINDNFNEIYNKLGDGTDLHALTFPDTTDTVVGRATTDTLTNKTLTSPVLNTGVSGTAVLDDDTFATASATTLATSESIKAYVDSQVTAQDLDFQGDSGGALNIDLDSESLTIAGGTGIDTTGASNVITIDIDSTVATLTGTQTLTNKTLTSAVVDTDISTSSGNFVIDPATNIVEVKGDGASVVGQLQLNCHVNSHGQVIASQPHSEAATNTLTLPGGTTIGNSDATLVSDTGTQTLTNKTIDTSSNTITVAEADISDLGSYLENLSEDTSPQLGGVLDTNGNNIEFPDSSGAEVNRLKFGAGDDLQIYHNGTNSYIDDAGSGDLFIRGENDIWFQIADGSETYARFKQNDGIELYYDNSKKIETTTNGVQISNGGLGVGTDAGATDGEIRATGDITAFYTSDQSLKENVKNIENSLDKINQINGVTFDWTDDYIESQGGNDDYFMRKHDVGVIAQEVEKVLPEVIGTRANGTKAVKYDRIVALLIEGIKDLNKQVSDLKTEIEELKK